MSVSFDLNIQNYTNDDLLRLFFEDIPSQLNAEHIKRAKQTVHKMHPDKSKLNPNYFIFFRSAYEKIEQIYALQNTMAPKKEEDFKETQTNFVDEKVMHNYLQQNGLKGNAMNKWFNQQFEKYGKEEKDDGYDEWLKSGDGIIETPNAIKSAKEINFQFQQLQKKNSSQMIAYDPENVVAYSRGSALINSASTLLSGRQDDYSEKTNTLNMTDLKQAYSSTITSSMGDVPQYKSLKEYENIRKAQNVSALSERESMSILKKQEDAILQQSREMAYQLSKEQERVRDRMQQFNSNILLLETGRQSGGR